MAPRREASIASSKPPDYNPRDLSHPEEIEAVEAECEEDDKQVENQDLEVAACHFPVQQHVDTCITGRQIGIFAIPGFISRDRLHILPKYCSLRPLTVRQLR